MKVTITYYGQARQVAGVETEQIAVSAGDVAAIALATVGAIHGEGLQKLLFADSGRVNGSVLVVVNGEVADPAVVTLQDGDEMSIMTALAGG